MRKLKGFAYFQLVALFVLSFCLPVVVLAQSSSTNYKVEETYFGSGGQLDASSSSYRARQSAGSLTVGNTSSSSYTAVAGNVTPETPFLEFVVTGATVNFGVLSANTTSYGSAQAGACNCSFYVRAYLSSEYVIVTASDPPKNEYGQALTAKATQAAPSGNQADEEFGMNLVANTVPGTFGANPVNEPDNTFADGKAETGYETTNQYKYNKGDIVARSPATAGNSSVGQTDFTISYIAKRKPLTPAGSYTMQHELIAVPTF